MEKASLWKLLDDQMGEVIRKFDGLRVREHPDGRYSVIGILEFRSEHRGREIEDAYHIEILIPNDYPATVPRTRSVDGKVPKGFHTYSDTLTFCTGTPLGEKLVFFEQPTLVNYIERLLVPYLFSYSCLAQYGVLPYGDLKHGGEGILSFYKELFCIDEDNTVLVILAFLADGKYKGHSPCPCGSGKKLRKCHGPQILGIMRYHTRKDFEQDYLRVFKYLHEAHKGDLALFQYVPDSVRNAILGRNRGRSLSRR